MLRQLEHILNFFTVHSYVTYQKISIYSWRKKLLLKASKLLVKLTCQFSTSLTDLGICYTFNGLTDTTDILRDSHFKDILRRNFGTLKLDKKDILYPDGVGPTNSYLMILDVHTTTSAYLRNKTNNNFFKLTFHEADSFPLVQILLTSY